MPPATDRSRAARSLDDDDGIRVLHVDDEPGFAEMVASFLERDGEDLSVVAETRPSEALDLLAAERIDCVVTDYQMPVMDGIEFIRAVREDHPDLPCIIYTGRGSEEVASEAIAAGATDYLQKGGGSEQYELLANRIENAVESYRAERRAATLERVRTVAREVNQALVRASSRIEIETRVCNILGNGAAYRAAWFGAVDPETDRIEPRATAGIDDDYFEESTFTARDSPSANDPVGRAVSERRLVVVDDVAAELSPGETRDLALAYDVQAIAAIPLEYDDRLYGVLVVCSDRPGTISSAERDLLEELGGDVAYAVDALETRAELRDERDRRAALFENAPNPIAEVAMEADSPVVTGVNDAFEDTFGFEGAEVEGRNVADALVPADATDVHEEIVARARRGEPIEREVRRETVDGERSFLLTVSPASVADESMAYVWYIDITDRKTLEREYREEANLLDQIFEQIPTSLYVKDTEGRHVRMSDYDLDPDEALGKTDPEVYGDSEFARAALADDLAVVETGEPIVNREEYNPDTGEWTLTSKVPWYGDDGEIKGLIGVSRLVTEKKEYERDLERATERLEHLTSVLGHDLRNPLGIAVARLDALRDDVADERVDPIADALARIDDIVDDVLAMARQEGAIEETEPIALSTLVERAWASVDTGGATYRVADDGLIAVDEVRALRLFENLLRNAVEHGSTSPPSQAREDAGGEDSAEPSVADAPEDAVEHGSTTPPSHAREDAMEHDDDAPTVTVGVLPDGFYVADDGPGVGDDDPETLFEPGYTTAEGGTGLGLTVVRDVARAHGWAVTARDDDGLRVEFTRVRRPD